MSEPIRLWSYIVVEEGDDVGMAFSYTAIASATQSADRLDGVARTIILRNTAGCIISVCVINDEDIGGARIEIANRREAPSKKLWTLTSTNDDGGSNGLLAGLRPWSRVVVSASQ